MTPAQSRGEGGSGRAREAGRRMRGAPCGLCAALGPSSSRGGSYTLAAGPSRGWWILRIFSPNPPTRPWVKNRPRTLMKGDSPSFHALIAGAPVGFRLLVPLEAAGTACGPRRWVARGVRGRACGVRLAGTGVGRGEVAVGPPGMEAGNGALFVSCHGERCRDPAWGEQRGPGGDLGRLPFLCAPDPLDPVRNLRVFPQYSSFHRTASS